MGPIVAHEPAEGDMSGASQTAGGAGKHSFPQFVERQVSNASAAASIMHPAGPIPVTQSIHPAVPLHAVISAQQEPSPHIPQAPVRMPMHISIMPVVTVGPIAPELDIPEDPDIDPVVVVVPPPAPPLPVEIGSLEQAHGTKAVNPATKTQT
jgi:hypothetical protein